MQIGHSDNISIVSASVEYYFPEDSASLHLSIKDEGAGPYISLKIDGEITINDLNDFHDIIMDFSTRFPLPIPPPSNDTE